MSEEYRGNVFENLSKTVDESSGWKSILLKWSLYVLFPVFVLTVLYFVIKGKISPSVMIEILNPGTNETNFDVPETGIEIEVKEASVEGTSESIKKKSESVSYISKVLSTLGEKVK